MYTFGGQSCKGGKHSFFSDVHRLNLRTLVWESVAPTAGRGPSARSQSLAFVYDDFVYVYGGYDGSTVHSDLHRLGLKTRRWEALATKGERPDVLKGLVMRKYAVHFCKPAGE